MENQTDTKAMEEERIRLTIEFSRSLLEKIDELRRSWGFRSRGATVERLLQELFAEDITTEAAKGDNQRMPLQ